MPLLLEDLADEACWSLDRVAARLDEESRALHAASEARERVVESARRASLFALSQLHQADAVWDSTLAALRDRPANEEAVRLLRSSLLVFEAAQRLLAGPRNLWALAVNLGEDSGQADNLQAAAEHIAGRIQEAKSAIDHRFNGWQPRDPDRFAQGLRLAAEGKAVPAGDAASRFRCA